MHIRKAQQPPLIWVSPFLPITTTNSTGAKTSLVNSPKVSRPPSKLRCSSQELIYAYSPSNLLKPKTQTHKRAISDAHLTNLLKNTTSKRIIRKNRKSEIDLPSKETSFILKKALESLDDKHYLDTCKLLELHSTSKSKLQLFNPSRKNLKVKGISKTLPKPKRLENSLEFKLAHLEGRKVIKAPKIFKNQIFTDIYDEKGNHDRVVEMSDYMEFSSIYSDKSTVTHLLPPIRSALLSKSRNSSGNISNEVSEKYECGVEDSRHELPKVMGKIYVEINLKSKLTKLFACRSRIPSSEMSLSSEYRDRKKC